MPNVQCAAKKDPLKQILFLVQFSIFYKIFRDYSPHSLPLLLQILSSYLSLFSSSTALNIKDDFFQLHRQINQTTTNFQAYFKHMTRSKCRKKYQLLVVKNRNISH